MLIFGLLVVNNYVFVVNVEPWVDSLRFKPISELDKIGEKDNSPPENANSFIMIGETVEFSDSFAMTERPVRFILKTLFLILLLVLCIALGEIFIKYGKRGKVNTMPDTKGMSQKIGHRLKETQLRTPIKKWNNP